MKKMKLSVFAMSMLSAAAFAQQAQVPTANGTAQAMPPAKSASAPASAGVPNNNQIALTPPSAGPVITNTAPQFLPKVAPQIVNEQPTVSAYGTPIYYPNQQVVNGQPVYQGQPQMQQQSPQMQQLPAALPPLPQPSIVNQSLSEAGLYLTPNQIREMKKQVENMTRASAEEPSGRPPRAETHSVTASLTPGSTPPVIRLYMNYPTSIVVVDSAGNPWPIDNFAGGSTTIEIKRPIEKDSPDSASITLTPRTATGKYTHGGLTLYLKGLAIPVSLTYVGGQPVVDQRIEVRIPVRGPNTSVPTSFGIGPAANPSLLSLLDGVAPNGAKALKVNGAAQAWSMGNGRMLVRTPLVVISPGYINGMKSADGTNAYEMEQVSELKAISGGKITSITIDY